MPNASRRNWHRRVARVYEQHGYVCWICRDPIDPQIPWPHSRAKTVDHVIPRSKGGGSSVENLRPAHHGCNTTRGDQLPPHDMLSA